MEHDPLKKAEEVVKKVNAKSEKISRPVLSKYPVLFGLLIIFSGSAIVHSFEIFFNRIELFHEHPVTLLALGILLLILTGTLYSTLNKAERER